VFSTESDQESHESELADRSLFVQELLLLAVTAAADGTSLLPPENPTSEISSTDIPRGSPVAPLLNSVGKAGGVESSRVVNCGKTVISAATSLHGKNSAGTGKSKLGNSQQQHRSLMPRDMAGGAKR